MSDDHEGAEGNFDESIYLIGQIHQRDEQQELDSMSKVAGQSQECFDQNSLGVKIGYRPDNDNKSLSPVMR